MSSEEIIILDVEEKVFGGYMEKGRKKEIEWGALASKLFCVAALSFLIYMFVRYALGALMPFIIAYLFSLIIEPVASFLSKRSRAPKKLCAFFSLSLVLLVIGVLFFFGVRRLVGELSELVEGAAQGEGGLARIFSLLGEALERISSKFGFLENASDGRFDQAAERVWYALSGAGEKLLSSLVGWLGEFLKNAVSGAPSFLIGVAVTVISAYYFCIDGERITSGIKGLIPQKHREGVTFFFAKLKDAAKRYARAYLLLMAMTFVEIFVGLLLLGVRYAFLIALGIAVVDILPVLGAGVVLVPWAVCALLLGNMRVGLGLLILYGVVTIIRQIAEPRVIGSSIGIHPAAALFSSYVGLKLFGFFGIILGPAAAFMISEIINAGRARS